MRALRFNSELEVQRLRQKWAKNDKPIEGLIPTLRDAVAGPGANKTFVDSLPKTDYPRKPDPFIEACKQAGLPPVTPEFMFHPTRKWRFDYAITRWKVAIEFEGGVWTQGRHTRGTGYVADMEKYNEAQRLGWRVFRYLPTLIGMGKAVMDLRAL